MGYIFEHIGITRERAAFVHNTYNRWYFTHTKGAVWDTVVGYGKRVEDSLVLRGGHIGAPGGGIV